MDWLQQNREIQNNQLLFNIQELLKVIANQQQEIIKLMKDEKKKTTITEKKK